MSASILSAFGAASAARGILGALGDILFGASGPVVLGEFVFQDMEVPATLSWGGQQAVQVHKLPGGVRVIDAMGRDDMPLSWSGIMLSADRERRQFQLDEMRIAGQPVPLSWGSHLYTVVITSFVCKDAGFRGDYQITCEVLRDESQNANDQPPSLLEQITDDINIALAIGAVVLDAVSLGQAIAGGPQTVQTVTQGVGAATVGLTPAAAAQVQAIVGNLQTVQTITQGSAPLTVGATPAAAVLVQAQAVQTSAVALIASGDVVITASPLGLQDPASGVASIAAAVAQSGAQAGGWAVLSTVGRVIDNLSGVSGATDAAAWLDAAPQTLQPPGSSAGQNVTQVGGDLFHTAAQQLGDATQWYRIAQASTISDPMLSGVASLSIPDPIAAPSNGIPDGQTIL